MTFEDELRQIIEITRAAQGKKDAEDRSFSGQWDGIAKIAIEVFNAAGAVFSGDPDYSCWQDSENGSKYLRVKKRRGGGPERWLSLNPDNASRRIIWASCFAELEDKLPPERIDEGIIQAKVRKFVFRALTT